MRKRPSCRWLLASLINGLSQTQSFLAGLNHFFRFPRALRLLLGLLTAGRAPTATQGSALPLGDNLDISENASDLIFFLSAQSRALDHLQPILSEFACYS